MENVASEVFLFVFAAIVNVSPLDRKKFSFSSVNIVAEFAATMKFFKSCVRGPTLKEVAAKSTAEIDLVASTFCQLTGPPNTAFLYTNISTKVVLAAEPVSVPIDKLKRFISP